MSKHLIQVMDSSFVKPEHKTHLEFPRTSFVICYEGTDLPFNYKLFYPEKAKLDELIFFLAFSNWWSHNSSVLHETAQKLRKVIIRRIQVLESQS